MRPIMCVALLALVTGCDALVGGDCADGFVGVGQRCEPITGSLVNDGGGSAGGGSGSGGDGQGFGGHGELGVCDGDETSCSGVCVDVQTNVDNCGACGHACASGICVDGQCEGIIAGHVVVLGMNYTQSTASARRLLGNAAFLPFANPLQVLDYRAYAQPQSVDTVHDVLAEQGAFRNRKHIVSVAPNDAGLVDQLAWRPHVVLIHDQATAPRGWGASFAAATASALLDFAAGGGTVIVLATTDAPEMVPFINGLGLMHIAGATSLMGTSLDNAAPTDVIGVGVATPFLAKSTCSAFIVDDAPDASMSFVVTDAAEPTRPVVIHNAIVSD